MNWIKYYLRETDSTNTVATAHSIGSVVIAERQTNGRGRNGRVWHSLDGNLFLSVVLPAYGVNTPLLSFVTGVALGEALSDFNVRLKWPNDVLLNGAKVAGILLEAQADKVIAGFGVNICRCPISDDVLYPTISLNGRISKTDLTDKLLKALSENLELFETKGFEPIRQKWLKTAVGLQQEITVRLPHKTVFGVFEALTPQGAISLKQSDGTYQTIVAGDIFIK
ncbi:MAG: biotin--[Alphaproteobacteria bacterium]|nr:biotin--[acetyl-CoA-carboxylase] ligase [Alphaproteobacteria bacterium]